MRFTNSYFGHDGALARYTGDGLKPILGYLQHGWDEAFGLPDAPYLRAVPKLLWSDRSLAGARRLGLDSLVGIGAPFLYLDGGHAPLEPEPEPIGDVIVYPYHSWDYDTESSHDRPGPPRDDAYHDGHAAFAKLVAEREQGSVTVCLYWRDHQDDRVRQSYVDEGLRVICHGQRHDGGFVLRQRHELRGHRRAVANRIGTAMWYAGHLSLALEVYGPFTGSSGAEARFYEADQRARYPELFLPGGANGELAKTYADAELGVTWKRDPDELREILGWMGWRRAVSPAVELLDRAQHRLRWERHKLRRAHVPPPWETGASGG